MNVTLKLALAAAGLVVAGQAAAQVTFYEREGFEGRSFTTSKQVDTFDRYGFNDRASSVVVAGRDRWEVCDDAGFSGKCVILRPGRYPSLSALGLENRVSSTRAVSRNARVDDNRYAPPPVAPQVTFYEREGLRRSLLRGRPGDQELRTQRLQRPRLLRCRGRRPVGSLRQRPVQGALRRPASGPVREPGGDGPERPHLVDAGS